MSCITKPQVLKISRLCSSGTGNFSVVRCGLTYIGSIIGVRWEKTRHPAFCTLEGGINLFQKFDNNIKICPSTTDTLAIATWF